MKKAATPGGEYIIGIMLLADNRANRKMLCLCLF